MKMNRLIERCQKTSRKCITVIERHPLITWLVVMGVATAIFALRNVPAFTLPNFYAEDATILFENVYSKDIVATMLTGFNGYLVVGLYAVAYVAAAINELFGGGLDTLAVVTAAVSCFFLGFAASLPFILFRRQLGVPLALVVVLMTCFVPIAAYDYAIIGTIGNLKFVFLYIATLFVVYRLVNPEMGRFRTVVVDAILLFCTLTNVTVAFLLPVLLLPYVIGILTEFRMSRAIKIKPTFGLISAAVIVLVGAAYTCLAILKGIPKIPGYLDTPYNAAATLPLAERTTFFAFTHPITPAFNSYFVAVLLFAGVVALLWCFKRQVSDRYVIIALLWAMFLGTVLFVINRPGIGELYLNYLHKGGPDQFFMAQNMIFIFLVAWVSRAWIRARSFRQSALLLSGLVLYALLAFPLSTSFGHNSQVYYQSMQPIEPNLEKACREYAKKKDVIIQVYPTTTWQWSVDHDLACER